MEINGDDYSVKFDDTSSSIIFSGSLRLCGTQGYAAVTELLDSVLEQDRELITMDLTELQFLNSTGITTISKFIIKTKNRGKTNLAIEGNSAVTWQRKTLKHLIRLMPSLTLEMK